MAKDHKAAIDEMVKKLRDAADQLETYKDKTPEEAEHAVESLQSCCGDCTLLPPTPPCASTCVQVSALW